MDRRLFVLSFAGAVLVGFVAAACAADETKTHEGIIVSASADKLVMTDNQGKNEHSHMVTTAAKIMLDGKQAKLADLKKGHFVKVTTTKTADGKESVTAIDARSTK
jgi:hypothetical protein